MNPLRDKLVDLWHARELLRQFVAKELKIRYKNSALGFFWSLLTPALMTVVFTALFGFAFRLDIERRLLPLRLPAVAVLPDQLAVVDHRDRRQRRPDQEGVLPA